MTFPEFPCTEKLWGRRCTRSVQSEEVSGAAEPQAWQKQGCGSELRRW